MNISSPFSESAGRMKMVKGVNIRESGEKRGNYSILSTVPAEMRAASRMEDEPTRSRSNCHPPAS
jgi:hypothetical protein